MTCDQFNALWRRLETTRLTAGDMLIGATASELIAFERHSNECQTCHAACEAKWAEVRWRHSARTMAALERIAAMNVERISAQASYDEELL
jgi:hypothetical protein